VPATACELAEFGCETLKARFGLTGERLMQDLPMLGFSDRPCRAARRFRRKIRLSSRLRTLRLPGILLSAILEGGNDGKYSVRPQKRLYPCRAVAKGIVSIWSWAL